MLDKIKQHSYWKFLKEIFPGTKFLLIRNAVLGIYFIVFTLYANQFEIVNLTYFNSVYILYFIGEMIGFSISTGISVFMNQNIEDKNKVANYIKLGTILSFVFGVLFIIILILFKDLIFIHLMKITIPDQYQFFYMMLPVMCINMVTVFWMYVTKNLQKFKTYLWLTALQTIIIVSLFAVSLGIMGLSLQAVPIIFAVSILTLGILLYVKMRNGSYIGVPINFARSKEFKLKTYWIEIKKVMLFCSTDILWSISTTLAGIFLLSNSEIIYNAYNYFENVYDVLNGIFFAFVSVVNISICISLGQGNFKEAYQKGKYAILTSIGIWVIYALFALATAGLVTKGMNVETMEMGKMILLMYLLIYLFRFIDWAIGAYIIVCGGNIKITFFFELFSFIYFITLIGLSSWIPNQPHLLILLVGFDSVVKGILYFRYFKSKKWLVKVSE